MKKRTGIMILAGVCAAGLLQAELITKVIDADAEARMVAPDTNYGTSAQLLMRKGATDAIKPYLKVDVGSILGAEEVFSGAKLSLKVHTATTAQPVTFSLYGIVDNLDAWTETELTWNNAPKNDTTSDDGVLAAGTVLLATLTVTDVADLVAGQVLEWGGASFDQYLNWTAGAIVDPYGNGASTDTLATLILVSDRTGSLYRFHSKDTGGAGDRPFISAEVIPEPATLGLFAISSVGILLFRRIAM